MTHSTVRGEDIFWVTEPVKLNNMVFNNLPMSNKNYTLKMKD